MPQFPVRVSRDPMRAQQYRVTNPNKPEDIYQPLYDRVNYPAAGVAQLSFFASQLGQSVTLITAGAAAAKVKTKRDTNLDTSGVVPTKLFQFIGVSVSYVPLQQAVAAANTVSICDDILRLKYGSWLDFKVIDKPILQMPTHLIPESNPVSAASTTINASSVFATGIQSASPIPMYKFGIPITLNPFESFSVSLNFDGTVALTQTFDVYMTLHSFMRRPT